MRDLQYLVVFADELNFSRAADRLMISQPTLSQTVKRLERLVGGALIERTTRRSRLTPAGEVLVDGARQLLADLTRLEQVSRETAAGRMAALKVGAVNPAMRTLMPRMLISVRKEMPNVRITLHSMNSHSQIRQLIDGQLEAGVLRSQSAPAGLAGDVLMHEPLYAAVARSHRLAEGGVTGIADLDGEDFVMASRDRNPAYYDALLRLYSTHDCSPRRILDADDLWSLLAMIAAGDGVAVLPLLFVDRSRDDVVFFPVGAEFELPLMFVYSPTTPSAALAAVRRAALRESAALRAEAL